MQQTSLDDLLPPEESIESIIKDKAIKQAFKWLEQAPAIKPFDGVQRCMLAKSTFKQYGMMEEYQRAQDIENQIAIKLYE